MTNDDCDKIESSLSVTLPGQYRRLMFAYPFGENSLTAQAYVPNNVTYVCSLNRQIREDTVDGNAWRRHYFGIGTTLGGDGYFLDKTRDDSPVFKVIQIVNAVSEVADTLKEQTVRLRFALRNSQLCSFCCE